MSRPDNTRQRMLASALTLLQERGANGVTLDAVLAHSGTPRGSIYHHFPGGRDQIVLEAGKLGGDFIATVIEQAVGDPRAVLDLFVDFWKKALTASDFRTGCPIVALAVDRQDRTPAAEELAREAFQRWATGLTRILREAGAPDDQATRMASAAIAAIEGAIILCRVQRSTVPLDDVAALLSAQLAPLPG